MTTYPQTGDLANEMSRADGTTELHSADHGRIIETAANVKHHGAAGNSSANGGGTSDSDAINLTIEEALGGAMSATIPTPARRGADGLGRVYVPAGYYRLTSPLVIRSIRGIHFEGAGVDSTVFVVDDDMAQAIQLYGVSHGYIGGFSIYGAGSFGGGPTTTYGVSWDWVSGQADSSSSRTVFDNIWVADLDCKYGFGIGVESANYDVSNGRFRHCNVNGNRTIGGADTTLYQSAFQIGNGTNGNVLNFDFDDCCHQGVKTCYYIDSVNRVAVQGGQATNVDEYVYKGGGGTYAIRDVRVEEATRFLRTGSGASWTTHGTVENIHWDPGSYGDDNGRFISVGYAGSLSIRGMHVREASNNSSQQRIYLEPLANKPVYIRGEGLSVQGMTDLEDFVEVANSSTEAYADYYGAIGMDASLAVETIFPARFLAYNDSEASINPNSIRIGNSAGPTITQGLGSPEGALTAPKGSVFQSKNAGFFYKGSGVGNTGWLKATTSAATGPYIPTGTTATNLLCWFDANEIDGLADGDLVSEWFDSTGQTLSLAQTDSSLMPSYQTAEVNGYPVVRWTTGSEYLFRINHETPIALSGSDKPMTVFVVYKRTSARAGTDYPIRFTENLASHFPIGISAAANNVVASRADDTGTNVAVSSAATGDANYNVWASKFTGTDLTIYKDGGTGIASITAAAMDVGTTTLNSIFIGDSSTLIGDVAEILVYDTALADTPRHEIQTYLGTKYNIVIT